MKSARLLLLSLLLLLPAAMSASERDSIFINQFVKDSFTKYGVRNALVTIMTADGQVIDTVRTMPGNGSHDAQLWGVTVPRRRATFRIRVEHPDYETGEIVVEMKNPARLNSYRFTDMLLKRTFADQGVNLGEVKVKATRVKLCYKGDTIEVDARAFKLTEGSMLESLVKNVPGCELRDDGEIYMNGRKVDYLTLNGKDFFKGNNRIMLDNLPYYTVDKLQFYNKQSERSQLMGKDVERPDYVMNVKLRQEYSIGYLGNVEAGAGTHDRWLGRGFALRFTDNSRLSLFGNANNINESRHPGEDGKWGQAGSPEGDRDSYNVGGDLMIDDKHGRYKEEFNTSLLWSKARDEQRTTSQQFIESGDTYGYSNDVSKKRNFALSAKNKLSLRRLGLLSSSRVDYSHHNDNALTRSAQFSQKPHEDLMRTLDSIFSTNRSSEMQSIMVNNVRDAARDRGNTWEAEQKMDYHKSLPWGDDLMLNASGLWSGSKNNGNSDYYLRYADGASPDDIRYRLMRDRSHLYDLRIGGEYALHFLSGWHLMFSLAHGQKHTHERDNLYRLDWDENFRPDEVLPSVSDYLRLRDAANSPRIDETRREEQFTASLHRHLYDSGHGRYLSLTAALDTRYLRHEGTYRRGENTARPSDYRWLLRPSVDLEYQTRKWHDTYQLHYDTEMRPVSLAQKADLTDTSNPLAIQTGNPHLRPATVNNISALFYSRFGTHGQFAMLRSGVTIMDRLVAMNSIYDKATGAYTYIPVNVSGNWSSNSSVELRRALTEDRSLNIESHTAYNYLHSVDLKNSLRSTVNNHFVEQNLKLEYKRRHYTVALLGGISWNGMRLADVDDINNVNFNYGANIQADLPLRLLLSTDIRMYSRRGYADRSLCTDDLLWNMQLSRPFCKGRLLASLKAFDLLHQLSTTHTTFNSQARVETWRLSLPSYFMASLQYKFNKNPKKTP